MRYLLALLVALTAMSGCRKKEDVNPFDAERAAARARDEARAGDRERNDVARLHQECRASVDCTGQGRCTFAENIADSLIVYTSRCIATSLTDCIHSEACKALGWCSLNDSAHVCYIGANDCAGTEKCTERGMCTRDARFMSKDAFDRICVATAEDCKKPEIRKKGLRCFMDNVCVPPVNGRCVK